MTVLAIVLLVLASLGWLASWLMSRPLPAGRSIQDCPYCGSRKTVLQDLNEGRAFCFHCGRRDQVTG